MKTIVKTIVYVIAAGILFVALLVILGRLLEPFLDDRRADIERQASALLNVPIKINNVDFSWYGYQPEINLNDVVVFKKDSQQPALEIKKISIVFSMLKSLWHWRLLPSGIIVSGTEITVSESAAGEFSIHGFPTIKTQQPLQAETKLTDVMGWLALQPRLLLENIDIYYTPASGKKMFVTLYDFNLINSD
ncbi:MAG TPA: hypothetical protein VHZ76_09440, partial [Gammaproteobacteria bacterium]|nr:hypothetical protein [Gammaproteobacteria bacterium]